MGALLANFSMLYLPYERRIEVVYAESHAYGLWTPDTNTLEYVLDVSILQLE